MDAMRYLHLSFRTRYALAAATVPAVLVVASMAAEVKLVLLNRSASIPLGLYVRDFGAEPKQGRIVAFHVPDAAEPTVKRYVEQSIPALNNLLIIKRIVAGPGNSYCLKGDTAFIDSKAIATVERQDSRGNALPIWKECRPFDPSEYFVFSDVPHSFDSRYYGPINNADIEGVFQPLWTW